MTIVFYKVDNSLNYDRHDFDAISDKPQEIIKKLKKLPKGEVKFYDTAHYGWGAVPSPNMADFEADYNNEELDGGWWCIVLNTTLL